MDQTGKLAWAVVDHVSDVETFSIDKKGKLASNSYDVLHVADLGDFRVVISALKGILQDQFGLPRSSKPTAEVKVENPVPKGPVTIRGKVVDLEGRPVPAASVTYGYREDETVKAQSTG